MKTGILLSMLVVGASAFAGGSTTVGPSICSYANYRCDSKDSKVVACVFEKFVLLIDERDEVNGQNSANYPAVQLPPEPHRLGAPVVFAGKDINVSICTTCAPRPEGQAGHVTAPAFKLKSLDVSCVKRQK